MSTVVFLVSVLLFIALVSVLFCCDVSGFCLSSSHTSLACFQPFHFSIPYYIIIFVRII